MYGTNQFLHHWAVRANLEGDPPQKTLKNPNPKTQRWLLTKLSGCVFRACLANHRWAWDKSAFPSLPNSHSRVKVMTSCAPNKSTDKIKLIPFLFHIIRWECDMVRIIGWECDMVRIWFSKDYCVPNIITRKKISTHIFIWIGL